MTHARFPITIPAHATQTIEWCPLVHTALITRISVYPRPLRVHSLTRGVTPIIDPNNFLAGPWEAPVDERMAITIDNPSNTEHTGIATVYYQELPLTIQTLPKDIATELVLNPSPRCLARVIAEFLPTENPTVAQLISLREFLAPFRTHSPSRVHARSVFEALQHTARRHLMRAASILRR